MYKRRARVLFVAREAELLRLARETLARAEGAFMQGRGLHLEASGEKAEAYEWADLVVALDEDACAWLHSDHSPIPVRCWTLPAAGAARREYLRRQLASMAAGMRMMQRLDG
jgi:hypothetical protein